MILIYNDKDITDQVEIMLAEGADSAGDMSDRCEVHLSDASRLWETWKPQKNDTIELKKGGYSTGKMRIDQIRAALGSVKLEALSAPSTAMTKNIRAWEHARFKQIANDLADAAGMTCVFHNITDTGNVYSRVDQDDVEPLEFLRRLCAREGYRVKVTDGVLHIYDEQTFEKKEPVRTFYRHEVIHLDYLDTELGMYSRCIVTSDDHSGFRGTASDPGITNGSTLMIREVLSSSEEGTRFSNNYLRNANKFGRTIEITVQYSDDVAGSSVIRLEDCGLADGEYFVEEILQKFTDNESIIRGRAVE